MGVKLSAYNRCVRTVKHCYMTWTVSYAKADNSAMAVVNTWRQGTRP